MEPDVTEQLTNIAKNVESLKQRMDTLEKSDRRQSKRLKDQRKALYVCIALVAIGLATSLNAIQDKANRELLERVAIGLLASGFFGAAGAGFIKPKDPEEKA